MENHYDPSQPRDIIGRWTDGNGISQHLAGGVEIHSAITSGLDKAITAEYASSFKNPVNTIKEVMELAKQSAPEITAIGEAMKEEFGGSVTPVNLKTETRIEEKTIKELGGNVENLKDSVRITNVVPYKDLDAAAAHLTKLGAARVKIQEGDEFMGYRGILSNFVTKNGVIGEVQVVSAGMLYAKVPKHEFLWTLTEKDYNDIAAKTGQPGGLGHLYYEQYRSIDPQTASKADLLKKKELFKKSKEYYKHFYGI